eukprot:TRINITY_DN2602_c0_g1_i12.p1 TRINITY_DN2602_c0_g1~~TRINITY_DN2602_c0_g1_i12.p1  ORF type:complete len:393 (-),score=46.77 TRINITY_DN2602_c0_g1_i12:159-1307(-)
MDEENVGAKAKEDYELILKTFPHCISPSRRYMQFFWLQQVCDIHLNIKFFAPNFPQAKGIKIYGESEVMQIVEKNNKKFSDYCGNSNTVLQFMLSFRAFLKCLESEANYQENSSIGSAELERDLAILTQIDSVGFEKVTDISDDLLRVEFSFSDEGSQVHKMSLTIPEDYPRSFPHVITSLPDLKSPEQSTNFLTLYTEWLSCIEEFLPAWKELNELDRLCWVLDPDPPAPEHMYRRLAAGPSLSIQIELDPNAPFQLPKLKFFGPDSKVNPLREKLVQNADNWDFEDPLLNNLENILEIEFPDKSNIEREELKVDCWICYSYNLEGATPTTICREEKCSACFHQMCAYEWLKSLPDSRTMLDTIFGSCPYCKTPLSVKIPR